MKRYLAFIHPPYVRDMQAHTASRDTDSMFDDDAGWRDCEGPVLVADITAVNPSAVRDRLAWMYPDSNPEIFHVLEVGSAKEVDLT